MKGTIMRAVDLTSIGQAFGILRVCFDTEELFWKCHHVITLSFALQYTTVMHCF